MTNSSSSIGCAAIEEYLEIVEQRKVAVCERQIKFAAYVRRVFEEEELVIDHERLEKYFSYLKYFPFEES